MQRSIQKEPKNTLKVIDMMMKSTYIIAGIFLLTMVSCKKENMEVKKKKWIILKCSLHKAKKLNVKVVNAEDPVCGMKTAEYQRHR